MKQTQAVLKYMQTFGSITSLEAFRDLGITRLAAVIWDLKHDYGVPIKAVRETVKNRFDKECNVARYSIWT